MTDIELAKAKAIFKLYKEGKEEILQSLSHGRAKSFLNTYLGVTQEKVELVTEDEMLRSAFLSISHKTNDSSNLLVYLNRIVRINDKIDDGQPDLMSINWEDNKFLPKELEKLSIEEQKKLKAYSLYCDLETNLPLLLGDNIKEKYNYLFNLITLPDYFPKTESYHYNSQSLEKITKGAATEKFNRLQLYYFKELLETSKKEEVVKRMKSLTKEELTHICTK